MDLHLHLPMGTEENNETSVSIVYLRPILELECEVEILTTQNNVCHKLISSFVQYGNSGNGHAAECKNCG